MPRPFRFGVQSFSADSAQDWAKQVTTAETLGYAAFHLADHLIGAGPALKKANHPVQNLAAIPAMAYAAALSKSIKIGCRVFCIDYHHPITLIKSAMTIDKLSDGRLELGLGAGWVKAEYAALGIPFDSAQQRIDRLADIIQAINAFRDDNVIELSNGTMQWRDFRGEPKPVGKAPLMIGGGSRRILELAAREADIVSVNFNNRAGAIGPDGVQSSSDVATRRKIAWIKSAAGSRFSELELEIGAYFTFVTRSPDPIIAKFARAFGVSEQDMRTHPHALFGSVAAISAELERRRELYGTSYITVPVDTMEAFSPVVARLAGT